MFRDRGFSTIFLFFEQQILFDNWYNFNELFHLRDVMYDSPEEAVQKRFEVAEVVAAQQRQLVVAVAVLAAVVVAVAAAAELVVLVMQVWQQLKQGFPEKMSKT